MSVLYCERETYVLVLSKDLPQILENQWDKLKHQGINSIVEQGVKEAAERLITAMNAVGVYPVKAGELESFVPDVTSHGPGYAVAVLEKHPDLGAAEYNDMREFVESWGIWDNEEGVSEKCTVDGGGAQTGLHSAV